MTGARRLAVDSLASYLRFGVIMAVQFVLIPRVIDAVGNEEYGLWTLTQSVLGFLALADLGFATVVIRFTAECRGASDPERRNRILATVMAVYLALAAAGVLVLTGITPWYDALFDIPVRYQDRSVLLLWILGLRTLAVGLPLGLYRSALYGEQKIALVNLVQVGSTLVYAAASFVVLDAGEGLVGFAWVGLGSFLLEHVVYVGAAYGLIRRLRVSPFLADRRRLGETLSVSVYQFLVNVAALVLLRTDPILVNVFLPLSSVASYGVALRVAENAMLLLKQGINVLGPPIAEMHGRGEHAKIRQVLVSGAKFAFAPGVVLTAAAWVFASDAITFWVGEGFDEAAPVLVVLMTAMTLSVPQAVASSVFTMTGNHRITALVSVSSMVVHIGIGLVLVQFFDLVGLSLGTLTASVLVDNGFMIALARKYHGVGYREFGRRIFGPAVWPGIVQAGVTLGIRAFLPPENLVEVALEALPGMLVYCALFWRFGVEAEERAVILRKVLGRQ